MSVNEYRLGELAEISGVSPRNIRAYRERGLLDPPRRQGRSAIYDDYHLAQLRTIDELLGRGFTSAHIAEFFETVRAGGSVAELLGLQREILRPGVEPERDAAPATSTAGVRVGIDPNGPEGARLVALGVAQRSGSALLFTNPVVGRVLARSPDPLVYARVVLALVDAGRDGVEALADSVISAAEAEVVARYGALFPTPENIDDMSRWIADCTEFGHAVVADRLKRALRRRLVTAVSEFNAGLMADGAWPDPPS